MKPTVLVIDDEKTFRIVAEEALSAEGFTVTSASNGQAGLAAWQREPCDLVILDRHLPDTDGIAILETMTRESREQEHRHADRGGHRLRRRHQRGAGAQAGGLRLPVEAAPAPRVPGHGAQGDRGPAAARAGAPADRPRAGGDGGSGGRLLGRHEEGDRHGRQGRRGARHHRPHPGGVGDRQGADRRPDRAPHGRPQGRPVRGDQLRLGAGEPARERALRPRARRLHRRQDAEARPLRGGRRRHACCSTRSARCRWPPRPSC